jgi:dolichol-phosphate mannosyltransferase
VVRVAGRDAYDAAVDPALDEPAGLRRSLAPRRAEPPAADRPSGSPQSVAGAYELTVVVPTYNERDNIKAVIETLQRHLDGLAWEIIFVDDDSPDGTAEEIRRLSQDLPNVRCLQRIGRRGLSTACIEGMLASSAPFLAVIDADLQHDIGTLPLMLHSLKRDQHEIVVGSRYVSGGGTGNWQSSRVRLSGLATRVTRLFLSADLTDPMSGFFVLRRSLLDRTVRRLSGKGFKILLDLFMSADGPVRFAELPYEMRKRERGASKLDLHVAWEFLSLLADKLIGHLIPVRFILFVMVGLGGALMHIAALGAMLKVFGYSFAVAQTVATLVAMTVNFFLNNAFTYRDRRLRGWGVLWGLFSFYVACGLGAGINVVLADFLFDRAIPWWLAGLLGALAGSVWNFAITSSFTWKRRERRAVGAGQAAS